MTRLPEKGYEHVGGKGFGIYVHDLDVVISTVTNETPGRHSSFYLGQTVREYFNTIDETIKKLSNVSLEVILDLQMKANSIEIPDFNLLKNEDDEIKYDKAINKYMTYLYELYDHCLPLYIELRVLGYSHADLVE